MYVQTSLGLGWTYLYYQIHLYDQILKHPEQAETIEEADMWRRLVFLRSNNEEIGVLGLYEYMKPRRGEEIINIHSNDPNDYFKVGDTGNTLKLRGP